MPLETLAAFNLSVIPCYGGTRTDQDKKPRISWKKYQTERPTPEQIRRWFRHWPNSNWAIVTGAVSGVVVLDIDSDVGEQAVSERGVPVTVTARTANGRHLYFRHPGVRVGNWTKEHRPLPGCDFRGDGGYVMAPGSIHPSGKAYEWIDSIEDVELAEMPAWLLDICLLNDKGSADALPVVPAVNGTATKDNDRVEADVRHVQYAQRALESELQTLSRTMKGGRNAQLFSSTAALFELVAGGALDHGIVERELWHVARSLDNDPTDRFTDKEIRSTIESGIQAGLKSPRQIPASTLPARVSASNGWTSTATETPAPEIPPTAEEMHPLAGIFIPDWDNEPPAVPPILTLHGERIGSLGNLTTIIAAPGSGKSAVCEAICAQRLNAEADCFGLEVTTERPVLYIDTERSKADHWESWRRMTRRAGLERGEIVPEQVRFLLMKMIPTVEERRQKLCTALDLYEPGLLMLDGSADFVVDVNDAGECTPFLQWLSATAEQRAFGVLATIHHNPGLNEKARGHLGSDLQRRSESVIYLKKDSDSGQRTLTTNFQHGKVRNAEDRNETYFRWSDEVKMFVSCGNNDPSNTTLSPSLVRLVDDLFAEQSGYSYTHLMEAIMMMTKTKERNARKKIKELKNAGLVFPDHAGTYVKSTKNDNGYNYEQPF